MNNNAWMDMLIAALVIGLLLAAVLYGEPARGINYNPDCPSWAQKYKDIKCEVRK